MKYFKVEGMIEVEDHITIDQVNNAVIDGVIDINGLFAGRLKAVDQEGNEIVQQDSQTDQIITLNAKDYLENDDFVKKVEATPIVYKTLFEEDDCAPDAKKYFHAQFQMYFKAPLKQYLLGITEISEGDDVVYYDIYPHRIINEIGRWIVQKDINFN